MLRFFAQEGEKEFFCVCTYTCYEFVRPEIVTELAWRFNLTEYAMPFWIQLTRDLTYRVELFQRKTEEREKKEAEKSEKEATQGLPPMMGDPMMGGGMVSEFPMLMSGASGMDSMGGMGGMGMGGMMNGGMANMGMGGMSGMGGMPGMGASGFKWNVPLFCSVKLLKINA
jgi:clathrin heavy chain